MTRHILKRSPEGLHQQHPSMEDVTSPAIDRRFFEPLALLDLDFLDPDLAGRKVLCLAMSAGAVDEDLIIQEQAGGQWTITAIDGASPEDPTRGSKWAEPFESGPGAFDGLPFFEKATLVEAQVGSFERSEHVALQTGEPDWVQSAAPPSGEGWRFVARIESYHLFGSVFVFYKPETREAFHLLQFT